jgi:GNAT superfamily N-acetyltransferase
MQSQDTPICEVLIRIATEQDFEALDKLYYDFHQYHVRGVPGRLRDLGKFEDQDWSRLHRALGEIFANQDAVIFLAECSGHSVGLVEVYYRQDDKANPLIVPYQYAYLQSLMVSEPYRKTGIGHKLMEVARQWAREKGATEMRLDVWGFNRGALDFYAEMGYRPLRRTLVAEL